MCTYCCEKSIDECCEKSLDECFAYARKKELKWNPWVGDRYLRAEKKKKILFIGESHYGPIRDDVNFTRYTVYESHVNNLWGSKGKMINGLHRALFKTALSEPEELPGRESLWRTVAFYNFVQRLMETQKDKPSPDDFRKGWNTFIEVAKILKPRTVIFIGTTAMGPRYFERAMREKQVEHEEISDSEIRNRARTRFCKLKIDNHEMRLLSIRHTSSKCFSWSQWHELLVKRLPEELEYLRNIARVKETSNS